MLLGCWGARRDAFSVDYKYEHMTDWGRKMFVTPGIVVDGKLVVGLPAYLGAATSPQTAFCPVPGDAAGLEVDEFRRALSRGGALHALLNRYTQAAMVQISQNVVGNRSHSTEKLMARWLLTTQDRVGATSFR